MAHSGIIQKTSALLSHQAPLRIRASPAWGRTRCDHGTTMIPACLCAGRARPLRHRIGDPTPEWRNRLFDSGTVESVVQNAKTCSWSQNVTLPRPYPTDNDPKKTRASRLDCGICRCVACFKDLRGLAGSWRFSRASHRMKGDSQPRGSEIGNLSTELPPATPFGTSFAQRLATNAVAVREITTLVTTRATSPHGHPARTARNSLYITMPRFWNFVNAPTRNFVGKLATSHWLVAI